MPAQDANRFSQREPRFLACRASGRAAARWFTGVLVAGWVLPAATAAPLTPEEQARHDELRVKPLQALKNVDLADYLRLRAKRLDGDPQRPTPADEVGHYATKAVGQPFRLFAVRFDLSEGDCVVFVERALAICAGLSR